VLLFRNIQVLEENEMNEKRLFLRICWAEKVLLGFVFCFFLIFFSSDFKKQSICMQCFDKKKLLIFRILGLIKIHQKKEH
jgi:hypothetical protein